MYRMRQRELILGLMAAELRAARDRCCDLVGPPSRDRVCRPHAHAARPADDRRALPAGGDRAARARRGATESARSSGRIAIRSARARSRAPDSRSIGSCTADAPRLLRAPTGNTYGSIATVDYLLESVSAAAVLLAGLGRVVQDLLLWSHGRVRLSAARRRLRAVQQHHAAEAQSGRARTRARDRQQGARRRPRRSSLSVHNTPFGDIVDTEDDLQPLVFAMFRDATRAVKLVAAAMATAAVRRRAARGASG